MKAAIRHWSLFLLLLLAASCKKEVSCEACLPGDPPPAQGNQPPIARAGSDQQIELPMDSVQLDGTASTDPDGNVVAYQWRKISGPSSFVLRSPGSVKTMASSLEKGLYQIELKVTDDEGASHLDTVQVIVQEKATTLVGCDNSLRPQLVARLVPYGSLSAARLGMSVAAVGNKLLFAGGHNGYSGNNSVFSRVDIVDLPTNTWSAHELAHPRVLAVTVVHGTKVYLGGGLNGGVTNTVDVYDAASNRWSTIELPNLAGRARMDVAAAAGNKVVFVSSAYSPGSNYTGYTIVDIYDIHSGSWRTDTLHDRTKTGPRNISDAGIAATVIGSKIYLAGNASYWLGFDFGSVTPTINIYDVATDTWTTSGLRHPRGFIGALSVGNKNYWAGGIVEGNGSWTDVVEIRDMATGTSTFSCLSNKNAHFQVVQKGTQLVFFTTYYESGTPIPDHLRNRFDIYDMNTGAWSIGILPHRINAASIVSVNDVIYIGGGLVDGEVSGQVWKLEF